MRVLLSVALLLSLAGVSFGAEPKHYSPKILPPVTARVSAQSVARRLARQGGYGGNSGRSGRNNNSSQTSRPGYYDYFAGQAVIRSQGLYGIIPGAGGMQFIGGDDMPGTPAYIENPFCTPAYGHNHGIMPVIIINPFCIDNTEGD